MGVNLKLRCVLPHHAKTAAAVAACLLQAPSDPAFLLLSIDMSGIQRFLYSISSKDALKGLRTRSLYMSFLMEHLTDTILEACGFSRPNVIYCGGGKAHLLLPNRDDCLHRIREIVRNANLFLREHFDVSLYIAMGYAVASDTDLTSDGGRSRAFSALFHQASAMISRQKLRRYSASELMELNAREDASVEHECAVCGKARSLIHKDEIWLCDDCARMERFSPLVARGDCAFVVWRGDDSDGLPLMGEEGCCLRCIPTDALASLDKSRVLRVYTMDSCQAWPDSIPLTVGNYQPSWPLPTAAQHGRRNGGLVRRRSPLRERRRPAARRPARGR